MNNVKAFISYIYTNHTGDVQYIPEIMHGNTNSMVAGVRLGF